jgi:NAD(P)-dependent dehydrogenase (short-subunit alcohol dehydrogenase family)
MQKTAVVTGAASGIGRRTVERLLADGWSVWALDISDAALADHAQALDVGDRLQFHKCDVSDPESIRVAFAAIAKQVRKLDALICSAGVIRTGSVAEATPEDVDLMLDVNLKGPWLSVREALPLLCKNSTTDDSARVVIVGSVAGIRPRVGNGFYSASKAALHAIAGILAVELASSGVLVNVVAPGTVATPFVKSLASTTPGYKPSGASPLGRVGQPDDVADVIQFFLSDASKYVTGTVLPVDGGSRAAFVSK